MRPAEIADHIVPHRGDVNSSPTLAQHNLDQTSPLSFSIGGYVSASWNGRACKPKEETAWERKENFWESQISAVERTLMWYRLREKVPWSKVTKAAT